MRLFPLLIVAALMLAACGNDNSRVAVAAPTIENILSEYVDDSPDAFNDTLPPDHLALENQRCSTFGWNGKLNDGTFFSIWLQVNTSLKLAAGEISIDDAKVLGTTSPRLLVGELGDIKKEGISTFIYDNDGNVLGSLSINDPDNASGGEIMPLKGDKIDLKFDIAQFPVAAPDLLYEGDDNFSGYYTYSFSDDEPPLNYGSANIYYDDRKIRFSIASVTPNMAEADNYSDKTPAMLNENTLAYNMKECKYAFRAKFFPRFMVIKTTSGGGQSECFGHNGKLDGIYIRSFPNHEPIFLYTNAEGDKAVFPYSGNERGFAPRIYEYLISHDNATGIKYSGIQEGSTPTDATVNIDLDVVKGWKFKVEKKASFKSDFPKMWLASTKSWFDHNALLSFADKTVELSDANRSSIQSKYGRTIKRAKAVASIDNGNILVYAVQFADAKGKLPLAAMVFFVDGKMSAVDYPAFVDDDGSYAWNVDDDGEFIAPEIIVAMKERIYVDGDVTLFYSKHAPESITVGKFVISDGNAIDLISNSYYVWMN